MAAKGKRKARKIQRELKRYAPDCTAQARATEARRFAPVTPRGARRP